MYSNTTSNNENHSHFNLPSLSHHDYYQKSTFYSYPDTHTQEYYYPVYEWSEDELPIIDQKSKKKKEMNERITEINREFLENKQALYEEKANQLEKELEQVEEGRHPVFDQSIKDLDDQRKETIRDAKLMMIYQLSTADDLFSSDSKKVMDETMAERKEIQNALFLMIEEKRKKLKEEKDCEGDLSKIQQHQTRNRKRLSRKRTDLDHLTPISKKKHDRQRDNQNYLLGALSHRIESDIESDLNAMRKKLT